MQVKDYMQALSDEGQIRVEKIGSGNWYWSFLSEEKRARDKVLSTLREEKEKINNSLEELREMVEMAGKGREVEDEERSGLLSAYDTGRDEIEKLKVELDGYKDGDPEEVVRKKKEIEMLKGRVARWTDNIYCLEEYLREIVSGDREVVESIRMMYYGDEYIEGEGLSDYS